METGAVSTIFLAALNASFFANAAAMPFDVLKVSVRDVTRHGQTRTDTNSLSSTSRRARVTSLATSKHQLTLRYLSSMTRAQSTKSPASRTCKPGWRAPSRCTQGWLTALARRHEKCRTPTIIISLRNVFQKRCASKNPAQSSPRKLNLLGN